MLFGAHVSAAGGISTAVDRAEELGCTAVQVFTQSPRMWKPTEHAADELERFRERRRESRIRYVVCHALYLVNLATTDREMRSKSMTAMRASLETAARDRGGRRRLPPRLAPRCRARQGTGASRACATRAARADGRPTLAPARELRRRGRHDRALDGRARRPRRPPRPASAARHLPRLVPLVGVGSRRHRPRRAGRGRSRGSTRRSASTACAAST